MIGAAIAACTSDSPLPNAPESAIVAAGGGTCTLANDNEVATGFDELGYNRCAGIFNGPADGTDGNLNGAFEEASVRPAGYDPGQWDPDISNISSKWNAGKTEWTLPFEAMESVGSVIVYSKADFEDAGGKFSTQTAPALGCTGGCGTGAQGIAKWMFENGTVLHFSRNTGNVMRTKAQ